LSGGINALAYGTMGDDTLRRRIADYEDGNEGGILLDQYDGMKREITRRQDARSAAIVASYGNIDSREGRGRAAGGSSGDAGRIASAILGKDAKAPKEAKAKADKLPELFLDDYDSNELADARLAREIDARKQSETLAQIYEAETQRRIESARQANQTEREIEAEGYTNRLVDLDTQRQELLARHVGDLEAQAAIDAEYQALREDAELRHQASLGSITAAAAVSRRNFDALTAEQQRDKVLSQMGQMIAGAAQSSRAFFTMHKVASIAQTVINTHAAAMNAYKWASTWGGPGAGAIAAGVAIAAGAVQIDAIRRQQFGGGGSVGSVGGAGGNYSTGGTFEPPPNTPAPVAIAAAPAREINLTIIGKTIDLKTMTDEFLPALEEAIGNGAGNLRFVVQQG
jgi:hypothetical protein